MKNKITKLFVISLLTTAITFGQNITVQEATELAVKNNKDIKIGMIEIEKSKIDVDKAWKSAYFNVSYTASANKYFKDISSGGGSQLYGQNIALTQPLYTGGAIKSAIEIGKNYLSLNELSLNKIKKDTVLDTVEAYIDVYEAEYKLKVLEVSKENLKKNYEEQNEKFKLKLVTKPDLLEAERDLKSVEADIIQQKADIEIAKEVLGNKIGIEDSSNIEITPFSVEENFSDKLNLQEDLKKLEERNTEYQITLKRKEITKDNINVEKSDLMPKINGVVSYGVSNQNKISNLAKTEKYNGSVGVNFSWNIFDWGSNKLDVEKAKKNYESSEIESKKTLDDLKVNLKKVYYQLKAYEKSLEAKQIALEKAEEVYELDKERYSYRLITMKELLSTEKTLREAKEDLIVTKLRYYYLVSKYGAYLD